MATRQIGLEIKIVNREALSEIDKIVDNLNKKGISIKIDVSKGLEELEKVQNIVNEVNNKSTKIDIDTGNVEQASKKVDNLFFAGEVIDVDAYTGGFNLQIAFSTGMLAGKSVLAE